MLNVLTTSCTARRSSDLVGQPNFPEHRRPFRGPRGRRNRCRLGRQRSARGAFESRRRAGRLRISAAADDRSEEHTSELQSLMRISYAVFCLKKKTISTHYHTTKLLLQLLYTTQKY